jgi:hypothetical protein
MSNHKNVICVFPPIWYYVLMKITAETVELLEAAEYYAKALGIATLPGELDICLFSKSEEDKIASGEIDYFSDGEAVIYLAIELEPQEDIFEILAHEMVHLKQYMTGELKPFILGHVIWKDTVMRIDTNPREWGYWNSPWELEAFGRQQGLNYMRQV